MIHEYRARLIELVDGDTVKLEIDLGLKVFAKKSVRLLRVDTPETYGVKKTSKEYKEGKKAEAFTQEWFDRYAKPWCFVEMHKNRRGVEKKGYYGRWLAEISEIDEFGLDRKRDGSSLNSSLVNRGWGYGKSE